MSGTNLRSRKFNVTLTVQDREIRRIVTYRGVVKEFAIMYEALIEGKWRLIIKIDNAHGQAPHIHRYHPRRGETVHNLPHINANEALTWGQENIEESFRDFRRIYELALKRK